MLISTKDYDGGFNDVSLKQGIVSGYLNSFGVKDSDGDIIQQGAYKKSISERGPQGTARIKYLLDHDTKKAVGVFQILKEDSFGLYYEAKIGTHTLGVDYLKMVEEKIVTEHSIGFRTVKNEQLKDGTNLITEINLHEGSGLQFLGANEFTPIVGVKSEADLVLLFEALEKALKNGTYTDETFKDIILPKYTAVEAQIKSLTKPTLVTLPTKEEIAEQFKKSFKI